VVDESRMQLKNYISRCFLSVLWLFLIASFYFEQLFASSCVFFSKIKTLGYHRYVSSRCFWLHIQFPNNFSNTSMVYFVDHLNTCVHFVLLVDSSIIY